jgi:hypothetical protein
MMCFCLTSTNPVKTSGPDVPNALVLICHNLVNSLSGFETPCKPKLIGVRGWPFFSFIPMRMVPPALVCHSADVLKQFLGIAFLENIRPFVVQVLPS